MENFWNKNNLTLPPINTCKVSTTIKDAKKLFNIVNNFCKIFDNVTLLNNEAAMLSRVIYRMKFKFRNDKGFKTMEKVNRALLQYLNMNFKNNLKMFSNIIDLEQSYPGYIYLPTKQCLDYLLVRCQGFAKLMCRIMQSSEEAAYHMNERLNTGQSWPLALLTLSLFSRIRVISLYLLHNTCTFYNQLYPFLKMLKPVGVKWLPDLYEFPSNLFLWTNLEPTCINKIQHQLTNENNTKENKINTNSMDVDLGEVISREQFDKLDYKLNSEIVKNNTENRTVSKVKKKHLIKNIKDLSSLQLFMKNENKFRKLQNKKALSKNLNEKQWTILKKLVKKIMNKIIVAEENQRTSKKHIVNVKTILSNNIGLEILN